MGKPNCFVCNKRKSSRFCVAQDAGICSQCCGKSRSEEFGCPETCKHLNNASDYQKVQDERLWERAFRESAKPLCGKEQRFETELETIEGTICLDYRDIPDLIDSDIVDALKFLIRSNQDPTTSLPKPSGRALHVATEIEEVLELNYVEEWKLQDLILPALQRVLLSVMDHRDKNIPNAYLTFISPFIPVGDEPSDFQ